VKKRLMARASIVFVPLLGITAIALASAAVPVRAPVRPISRDGHVRHATSSTAYGGGATLPAIAYVGVSQATTTNPATDPDPDSVFGYFLSLYGGGFQYCQTGSGYGKKVLDGAEPASAGPNGPCAALGSSASGFGIPSSVQDFADFAGSDAPESSSDYQSFITDAGTASNYIFGRGEPVQVPYIIGAVALLYNNSDLTSSEPQVSLSLKTLCQIADGQITNWDQIPQDPAEPAGAHYGIKKLKWVYRADSSGTTFSFANYVSKSCTGAGQTYGLNQVYDINNNNVSGGSTTGVLPLPLPNGGTNANFLAGNGNPGVVDCIEGTGSCTEPGGVASTGGDGSIGYVEAANAMAAGVLNAPTVNFAELYITKKKVGHNYSPIADLPAAAHSLANSGLLTDMVVGPFVNNGRPSPLLEAPPVTPPAPGCLGIYNPDSYAKVKDGYPILAVTNLEFASTGNGSKASGLQTLAKFADSESHYGSGKITTVDPASASAGTTGFSGPNFNAGKIARLASCIGT